uniref:Uncharacterized protein n=1 Tax=Acrobeloides nanus TaxID=290746 RepID=A0A914DW18_9BILA
MKFVSINFQTLKSPLQFLFPISNSYKIGRRFRQSKNEYRVRFAGTLVDLKTKIEIFFEFEPVEKYPVGATLLINNGKLFRNNDAIRLYIKYSNQVKRLNEPIYDFNELTQMFDVNSLPFP